MLTETVMGRRRYSAACFFAALPRLPSSSRRYAPVELSFTRATSSGVPAAIMRPPSQLHKSPGFKPVRLAMRDSITGPISSSS